MLNPVFGGLATEKNIDRLRDYRHSYLLVSTRKIIFGRSAAFFIINYFVWIYCIRLINSFFYQRLI